MLGRTISHYHITSQIGEGGMGVVYEAEDINLGRHVALKFLHTSHGRRRGSAAALPARGAGGVVSQSSEHLHDPRHRAIRAEHFIIMELLDGESLADRIRRGPLDIDSLLTLGVQIVDALESAHSKGIVHRDLKPANIS